MKTIKLEISQEEVLVDDEDHKNLSVYKWYNFKEGVYNGYIYMARMIMNAPNWLLVDHRDGNTFDNRKSNLRLCTSSQNQYNQRKQKRKTSSQYKGVNFYSCTSKWRARIGLKDMFGRGYRKHLGFFTLEEAAARAYDEAARFYFKEFARLNFPNKGEQGCL